MGISRKHQLPAAGNSVDNQVPWDLTDSEEETDPDPWHLLDHFFLSPRPVFSLSGKVWNPPVNFFETPDRIVIRMEIAGVRPSDVSVTFEHRTLIIRGRRYEEAPSADESFHLMEIHHGYFERAFRLSSSIVEDEIKASYHDGFLDVEIPKGKPKGRFVRVKVREI